MLIVAIAIRFLNDSKG